VEGEKGENSLSTTTFITDANVVTGKQSLISRVSDLIMNSSTTGFHQDIIRFLEKPVEFTTGVLSSSDTVSTFTKFAMPSSALVNTIYSNKISGFLGFKADMRFKIVVNGTRFQKGRYILSWTPIGGAASGNAESLKWWDAHNNTLTQRTQLHRVEIDINCDTEGDLFVPFSSFLNYFPLATKAANTGTYYGDLGFLHLSPYYPLETITVSTVPFRILVSFENISLVTPAAPQMGRMVRGNKSKSLSDVEKDSQGVGPLSGPLLAVSGAASSLATIPLLSAYASTLGWASDIAANVAIAFGWSKPVNTMATIRNLPQILPYMGNVDTVDQSLPLSYFVKNEVENLQGFSGTDIDETSLKFIATIPAYFQTYSWSTAQAANVSLANFQISPGTYFGVRTVNSMLIRDYLPCAYVASKFTYWRGSVIFTFKIVKTEFHSGRLNVAFYPNTNVNNPTDSKTAANSTYTHREIVDIRLCNEFSVRIPYTAATPFTSQPDNSLTGNLIVWVYDPLVAPDAVPQTVQLLVEISMGDDCEFAVPAAVQQSPVLNLVPQMGMLNDDGVCNIVAEDIGGSSVIRDAMSSAKACIGESMLTFRSLLKMSAVTPPYVTTGVPAAGNVWLQICPFLVTYFWNQATPFFPTYLPTLYDELCSIFVYSRGGMRFKLVNHSPPLGFRPVLVTTAQNAYGGSVEAFTYGSVIDANDSNVNIMGKPVAYVSNTNAALEVQTPQYTQTHTRNNLLQMCAGSAMMNTANYPNNVTRIIVTTPGQTASTNYQIYRSVSDDFNLGCFVSIPPMRPGLAADFRPFDRS